MVSLRVECFAIRGINIQPGDLDFWVSDAQLAGEIFEDLLVEPVTAMTGWIADYGGRAFTGCLFEWIAGVHQEVDEPMPHEQGFVARSSLETVYWHGWTVPVAPLVLQLSVAKRRGITDRVASIRTYLGPLTEGNAIFGSPKGPAKNLVNAATLHTIC